MAVWSVCVFQLCMFEHKRIGVVFKQMLHIRSMKCKYPCSVVLITPTHLKWNIFKSLKLTLNLKRGHKNSSIWTLCCSGVCFHIVCKRLWHWIRRQYFSWKQWYLSNKLCGTTSQKANTGIFTTTFLGFYTCQTPEKCRSHLHHGRNLKSCINADTFNSTVRGSYNSYDYQRVKKS